GDGLARGLDRRRATADAGRSAGEKRLLRVSAASARGEVGVMRVIRSSVPDVLHLDPRAFGDERGYFMESYKAHAFAEATGVQPEFVQDNHSRSARGVLRGLHYQIRQAQGRLTRVTRGRVFDVAVDLRRSSPTFGRWAGAELSEENRLQMWV